MYPCYESHTFCGFLLVVEWYVAIVNGTLNIARNAFFRKFTPHILEIYSHTKHTIDGLFSCCYDLRLPFRMGRYHSVAHVSMSFTIGRLFFSILHFHTVTYSPNLSLLVAFGTDIKFFPDDG